MNKPTIINKDEDVRTHIENEKNKLSKIETDAKRDLVKILKDFRYEEKKNLVLGNFTVTKIFMKGGLFILHLGYSTFFEMVALMLLVKVYCYHYEKDQHRQY